MGRTAKIMGTLLQSEVAIRMTNNDRLMETLRRAMGLSIQLRHMIDEQVASALHRDPGRSELLNRIEQLEQRVATLEAERQSSKASS